MTPHHDYQSYRGLPTLAGLATLEEAARPGLGIEACVARLKRYHYCFKRLHEILTARITSEPIYELKTAFAHHAYLCAEAVEALRTRVGEMREPPLGLEAVPTRRWRSTSTRSSPPRRPRNCSSGSTRPRSGASTTPSATT